MRSCLIWCLAAFGSAPLAAQPVRSEREPQRAPVLECNRPVVIDGDTIRCSSPAPVTIRLIGIDAPELPGHCRPGRFCVPGDGHAARRNLERFVALGSGTRARRPVRLQWIDLGRDFYGRRLGVVYADGYNLACFQLASGHAVYKAHWDKAGRIARECGL